MPLAQGAGTKLVAAAAAAAPAAWRCISAAGGSSAADLKPFVGSVKQQRGTEGALENEVNPTRTARAGLAARRQRTVQRDEQTCSQAQRSRF